MNRSDRFTLKVLVVDGPLVVQPQGRRLVGGAALFGIGWGLSGCCPGPALVSLLYSYESTVVFCVAMFAGMALEGPLSRLVASS